MRILCLHGMGTNSDILAAQTEVIRSLLPKHYTYSFDDGRHQCEAAEGISEIFPAPYLCYHSVPTTCAMLDAHEFVREIVEQDGPFDGVLGFSQLVDDARSWHVRVQAERFIPKGAGLAASILLHHALEKPEIPAPFRFAILICSGLPYSTSPACGEDLAPFWASDNSVRRFHPRYDQARISIPVVHVSGKLDSYYHQGQQLVKFCEPFKVVVVEHDEGHNVPRSMKVTKEIVRGIEKAIAMTEIGF